ncbi:glycosyl hydrolase [Nocardioides sp. YIM 152588]|uniref:glycosyl hydrolase n=1 Tax=Nocardioides sp. YIM 152588 TaxID=3158259 RepID=UPI0032E4C18B
MTSPLTRRSALRLGGATATAAVVGAGIASDALSPALAAAGARSRSAPHHAFAKVPPAPAATRGRFRYWWPGAYPDPAEVATEVRAIADAGFGGFEIADVRDSVYEVMPPEEYGWGSPRWKAAVLAAVRTANQRGIKADITLAPHWPTAVPGIVPDDDSAAKELTYATHTLAGGESFSGELPKPTSDPSGAFSGIEFTVTPVLEAVHAARFVGSDAATPVVLDQTSLVNLTGSVVDGALDWTPPGPGEWIVIASWSRGTAQIQNMFYFGPSFHSQLTDPQSFVVDHFGKPGAQAVIDWWERDLLTSELRRELRRNGGAFFEDSLELRTLRHWTPDLFAEFEARRGYDVADLLPLVHDQNTVRFTFEDATVAERVRWDYEQTLSDLFIAHRADPLRAWAHTLGMSLRNQAYGTSIDGALAAAHTDVPEGESLAFGSSPDSYRVIAAGRDLGDRTVLSNELGAFFGAYQIPLAQLATTAQFDCAVGVNQQLIHGFAYATAPDSQWPGYHAFLPLGGPTSTFTFAEPWGPRQPQWEFSGPVADNMATTNQLLQTGTNRVDLAVYHQGFDATDTDVGGDPLTAAGFTYQPVTMGLLGLPAATVRGRRLAPAHQAFKALVVPAGDSLLLEVAGGLLGYARRGLPIVLVGDLPARVPGYADAAARDRALARTLARLVRLRSVRQVAAMSDVPAALATLGATPSVGGAPTGLLAVRRARQGRDDYYLHNSGTSRLTATVALEGSGRPYLVDPWSGRIEPVPVYEASGGRVSVDVDLAGGDSRFVILTGRDLCRIGTTARASSTDAPSMVYADGRLAVRGGTGTYTATTNAGRLSATITGVPDPATLGDWSLRVESWEPTYPGATGDRSAETTRRAIDVGTTDLVPWTQIGGLEDVSGIGTYTATLVLDEWVSAWGATLNLGTVAGGTARVAVNGRRVGGMDVLAPTVEIGRLLRRGRNTVEIEVATTLLNRLRISRPENFGGSTRQEYGLLGPVVVTPWAQAALR